MPADRGVGCGCGGRAQGGRVGTDDDDPRAAAAGHWGRGAPKHPAAAASSDWPRYPGTQDRVLLGRRLGGGHDRNRERERRPRAQSFGDGTLHNTHQLGEGRVSGSSGTARARSSASADGRRHLSVVVAAAGLEEMTPPCPSASRSRTPRSVAVARQPDARDRHKGGAVILFKAEGVMQLHEKKGKRRASDLRRLAVR